MRPANREVATRIDLDLGIVIDKVVGNDWTNDLGDEFIGDDFLVDSGFMPRRYDDGVDALRFVGVRVLNGYLALRIGTEKWDVTIASGERCCAGQSVGNRDGKRHQLFGLVDRVSDHYPLVACALVQVRAANRRANIRRLLVNVDADICALCVEVVFRLGVADIGDHRSRQCFVVDMRLGSDFPKQPHAV